VKKPPRCGDVVEVAWVDSEQIAFGWSDVDHYRKAARRDPEVYRSSGYWIDQVKGRVVIAQSLSLLNRHVTHVMSIPTIAVTSITVLDRSGKHVRRRFR
jgi:hypothetical protein